MPLPGLERDISSCTHYSRRRAPLDPSPVIQSCAARVLMLGSRNKLLTPVLCAIDRVMLWFPTMAKKGVLSQYLAELGRKGAKATAKKLTTEQTKETASKAAQDRGHKQNAKFPRDTDN